MAIEDMLKLVAAVAAAFGSGAVIVIALSKWLGDLWATRILQEERGKIERQLSELSHEFSLAKSSYDHYLGLILDYYKIFYRHYRLCQRASEADAHKQANGTVSYTKDDFFNSLDNNLIEWSNREGKIRLLLPAQILATHMEAIDSFNQFKHALDKFDTSEESRQAKREAFRSIDTVKVRLEQQLREFLRTEKLLK